MQIENRFLDSAPSWLFNYDLFKGSNSCIISLPPVYTYYLWCGYVLNRGQQNLGGLLVISYM